MAHSFNGLLESLRDSGTELFGRTQISCEDIEHRGRERALSRRIAMLSKRTEKFLIPIDDPPQGTRTGIGGEMRKIAHSYFLDTMDSKREYLLP